MHMKLVKTSTEFVGKVDLLSGLKMVASFKLEKKTLIYEIICLKLGIYGRLYLLAALISPSVSKW